MHPVRRGCGKESVKRWAEERDLARELSALWRDWKLKQLTAGITRLITVLVQAILKHEAERGNSRLQYVPGNRAMVALRTLHGLHAGTALGRSNKLMRLVKVHFVSDVGYDGSGRAAAQIMLNDKIECRHIARRRRLKDQEESQGILFCSNLPAGELLAHEEYPLDLINYLGRRIVFALVYTRGKGDVKLVMHNIRVLMDVLDISSKVSAHKFIRALYQIGTARAVCWLHPDNLCALG
jgi:hypothetical protein